MQWPPGEMEIRDEDLADIFSVCLRKILCEINASN